MSAVADNNRRIAKNSFFLYVRMFFLMLIGLFTSRVVLNALGINDYGLNNVVGGFVGMLVFLNGLLSQGSSRFLTYELGKGDFDRLRKTFSACLTIHFIMAVVVLLLGETIGLWFVNTQLKINPERMDAANWVYQFSLFSSFLSIMQTPYSASVTSHEKMSVYAYMSIFDAAMKLLIVYLLLVMDVDKLKLYSFFFFCTTVVSLIIYRIYCVRKFSECSFHFGYDKTLYKELFAYSGWNTIGAIAFLFNGEGVNVLLNIFFGTIVNASRGIALTVANVVGQFISNFQNAAAPQIIKYYSQNNYEEMNRLIVNNAKYSSYLFIIIGIPIFIEIHYLLYLWLGQVPMYSAWFSRLVILQIMITAIDGPIGRGIHAFGRMKLPNLTSAIIYLMVLPISYVVLKLGANPITIYIVNVLVYPFALFCDLFILHKYSNISIIFFVKNVILKVILLTLLISVVPLFLHHYMDYGICRCLFVFSSSSLISCIIIYKWGISESVRIIVINWIKNHINIRYGK